MVHMEADGRKRGMTFSIRTLRLVMIGKMLILFQIPCVNIKFCLIKHYRRDRKTAPQVSALIGNAGRLPGSKSGRRRLNQVQEAMKAARM